MTERIRNLTSTLFGVVQMDFHGQSVFFFLYKILIAQCCTIFNSILPSKLLGQAQSRTCNRVTLISCCFITLEQWGKIAQKCTFH